MSKLSNWTGYCFYSENFLSVLIKIFATRYTVLHCKNISKHHENFSNTELDEWYVKKQMTISLTITQTGDPLQNE